MAKFKSDILGAGMRGKPRVVDKMQFIHDREFVAQSSGQIMNSRAYKHYRRLLEKHGDPRKLWPQWCAKNKDERLREIVAIGAFLTQRTSWRNADLALRNLKKGGLLSLKTIAGLKETSVLRELIRPAGFYQTKPQRLITFASFVIGDYGSLTRLRKEKLGYIRDRLLKLYGVGQETADTLLLYCLDKPSFVIDEYTKRFVQKERLAQDLTYGGLKNLFERDLPLDTGIYQNYHVLIIVDQKGKQASLMKVL